jgi:protoporphyrinogen oxidase
MRSFYVEFSSMSGLAPEIAEEQALEGLLRCGLLRSRDEVLFAFARQIHGAYVLYDRGYARAKQTVLDFLAGFHVETCGRYGNWEYGGMEDALLSGQAAARRVMERR